MKEVFTTNEPITILVAEDEEFNYFFIKEAPANKNITIIRAINGLEAIECCKSIHIDLVLMDLKMPVMDGFEATRIIKSSLPELHIVAQTAYTHHKDQAIECGCNDFISKPLNRDLLWSIINKQFPGH